MRRRLSDVPLPQGLFDDDRPKNHFGQRLLLSGDIMPTFIMSLPKQGRVRLMVFLRSSSKGHKDFSVTFKLEDLEGAINDFATDPEGCIKDWFKYDGPEP